MDAGDDVRLGGKRYRVVRVLGSVHERYEVLEQSFGLGQRRCALQVVPNRPEVKRRLRRLHRASQENQALPTIFDVHYRGGSIYVVSEWIRGWSLEEVLSGSRRERRRFSCYEATRVIRRLAHDVEMLHRHAGIVHGDIKPNNLIIPKSLVLRLIDFGSSWFVEETTQLGKGFTQGASPGYAAPEQTRVLAGDDSLGHPDFRTDQFAVSVLYYELLTGKLPYEGLGGQAGKTDELIALYGPRWVRPSACRLDKRLVPSAAWDAIDQVLRRGAALAPADRYLRAGEWLDDLGKALRCFEAGSPLSKGQVAFGRLLLWAGDAWEAVARRISR